MSKSERVGVKALPPEQAGMTMRLSLLGLVVMVVLAACGEQVSDAPAGDQEETLADFLGWGFGLWSTPEDDPEAAREEFTRIQESIQQCMADQGFEYQPVVPPDSAFTPWVDELSEEERVRTSGFGITTWYGREDEFDQELGFDLADPNWEMVEAMSGADRDAWTVAMFGTYEEHDVPTIDVDPDTGDEVLVHVSSGWAGCEGEAYEAVYGHRVAIEELFWRELGDAYETMYQEVAADPRLVEVDQKWAACMAEGGYEFTDRDAMRHMLDTLLFERLYEIIEPDPFQGWTDDEIQALFDEFDEEGLSEEESKEFLLWANWGNPPPPHDEDRQAALEALQQEEIDLALADFGCRGDYFEVDKAVSREYEAAFIAEHREVLERIRDVRLGGP